MAKRAIGNGRDVECADHEHDESERVGDGVASPGGEAIANQHADGRADDDRDHVNDGPESSHDVQGTRSPSRSRWGQRWTRAVP